ncbi:hypothetical protein PIT23_003019 [Clostridioides difficile]|nr:hypothetical protein [Clostridioides difficile]HBH3655551.1 hypothetical protein [Clostridioides difficile]
MEIKTNFSTDARRKPLGGTIRFHENSTIEIIANKQVMRFEENGNVYYNNKKIGTDEELFKYVQIFFKSTLKLENL